MDGIQDDFEAELYNAVASELDAQRDAIIALGILGVNEAFWNQAENSLASAIVGPLTRAVEASAEMAMAGANITAVDITAGMSEQIGAATWARGYAFDKVKDITKTSRDFISKVITDGVTNQLSLDEMAALIDAGTAFGPVRAQMIAVTETTRAWMQGAEAMKGFLWTQGIQTALRWHTVEDQLVDDVCRERNMKFQGDGWDDPEPAHVNCRCFISVEPIEELF